MFSKRVSKRSATLVSRLTAASSSWAWRKRDPCWSRQSLRKRRVETLFRNTDLHMTGVVTKKRQTLDYVFPHTKRLQKNAGCENCATRPRSSGVPSEKAPSGCGCASATQDRFVGMLVLDLKAECLGDESRGFKIERSNARLTRGFSHQTDRSFPKSDTLENDRDVCQKRPREWTLSSGASARRQVTI